MNALILAAGYATRLYPLTLNKAKPLLDVAGKPMIEWVLDNLAPIPELETVYVVTNSRFVKDFQAWADAYGRKRKAPLAIKIINDLQEAGARIRAYDPAAMESARRVLAGVEYCEDEYEAASGSDALVVVTEWNQFRQLDIDRLKQVMREPNIIDLRNIYEPDAIRAAGFKYLGMGRN